jgi:hypothetical protein
MFNTRKKTQGWLALAVAVMLFPFSFVGLWIYVVETTTGTQAQYRELFLSYFPEFLQSTLTLTLLAIASAALAALFSFMALPSQNKGLTTAAVILMGIAVLFVAWFTFSLM